MSTKDKDFKIENLNLKKPSQYKIGIVVSEWNNDITNNLYIGAKKSLLKNNILEENITKIDVPGSFELIQGAILLINKNNFDAIITIGCIIKGETNHFDYVCQAVSQGIKDLNIKYEIPVIFGVLTDNKKQQSIDRSGGKYGNKGIEAGISALKIIKLKEIF